MLQLAARKGEAEEIDHVAIAAAATTAHEQSQKATGDAAERRESKETVEGAAGARRRSSDRKEQELASIDEATCKKENNEVEVVRSRTNSSDLKHNKEGPRKSTASAHDRRSRLSGFGDDEAVTSQVAERAKKMEQLLCV